MTVPVEHDNRIQIPRDWVEQLNIGSEAQIELTRDGVLIKPMVAPKPASWDDVFARKLPVGAGQVGAGQDRNKDLELTGDDYYL